MDLGAILAGALAGAAGTTALNAATYVDMALRGRPVSRTPEQTIERLADAAHLRVPGTGEDRENRLSGLGALGGIATGVAVGAAYGLSRLELRPPTWAGALVATGMALVVANGPMAALGVSDPRTWSAADWASDLLPHVAYGVVTAVTYGAMER